MIADMFYPGGKGKSYQQLINLMPPHRVYIESHLGGGAVIRHKRPAIRNIGIERDPAVIALWREKYSEVCELEEHDSVEYLSKFQFSGHELVYADPPYLDSTRRRRRVYKYDYSAEQHEALLRLLRSLPCMVMVSGYQNEMYDEFLDSWRKEKFLSKTHVDVRQECVWLNFEPAERLHDARFLGTTFRQRQTIQRRQQRLRERITRMAPIERAELANWMREEYFAPVTE